MEDRDYRRRRLTAVGKLLLGIDVGTSAVKAGIFDETGRLLGLGRSPYATEAPRPGWAQCDPELWWQGAVDALRKAAGEARVDPKDITAAGVGVLFPAVVLLDENARPLYPAILYCDQRSLAQVRGIERAIPRDEYESVIGNTLVPGTCAATSMAWLRDEEPAAYGSARVIGFANTFVTSRLTGAFATDPSMAALSGLVDIRDPGQWSTSLCRRLDIDPDRLPRIAGSAEPVGEVTAAAARETGLAPGIPVVAGAGDVPVSALGTGASSSDTAAYMAGSTDCVSIPMPGPTQDRRWVNCAYIPEGVWLAIGTTTSSGVSVEWFVREFIGSGESHGLERMTRLASSSPPGSGRVLYLPYLQGERTPVWDPLARGVFIGLTASTTRADLARAVFEGTAFGLRHVVESAESATGVPVKQIRAVGGGTGNPLWNRIKADVLKRDIHVLEFQETGTLGAALLAGLGCGVHSSFDAAVETAQQVARTAPVRHDPARAPLYDELFGLYTRIHEGTREISHALAGGD
ncbi:FGGY-family carbohydrate kinase [Verrucomicrobiota bacterium]